MLILMDRYYDDLPSSRLTVRPWQIDRGWKTSETISHIGEFQGLC